ncbi:Transmembrane protein [Melia azedarach]|uniref:Transmembrane protein n=1 Tax=Melia azedarach TaxID=155640 RepID=A0ACC1YA93_MELAZ|nr:Transmembrane protein [Melia azedarach]
MFISFTPLSKPWQTPSKFVLFAQNSSNNNGITNGNGKKKQQQKQKQNGAVNGDDLEKDRRPGFNIKWGDIFNPDPDNFFAVGLTGLLTWASVQVLWQLFIISLAILVAALKYSFIAALLLFILITLL